MRKYNMLTLIAAFSVVIAVSKATAQVVVEDPASIAHQVLQLAEMKRSYEQMINQTLQDANNFEENMKMIKGNNWQDLTAGIIEDAYGIPATTWTELGSVNVSPLRAKYGLTSSNPEVQASYDRQLQYMVANEKAYESQRYHTQNLTSLKRRAAAVSTPQQRQELSNAIAAEQASIATDMNKITSLEANIEQAKRIQEQKVNANLSKRFGG